MTNSIDFFEEYVLDRRRHELGLFTLEDLGYLIRYTPQSSAEGLVTFSKMTLSDVGQRIGDQIAYFSSLKRSFEWKLYDLDEPRDLKALLLNRGFVAGDPEVFMACSTGDAVAQTPFSSTWPTVRIENAQGVRDVVSVQEQVWGRKFDWLADQLMGSLEKYPESISIYCVYVDGIPVGTGWTDFPKASKFPELHGGAVLQAMRGKGIYKSLHGVRVAEAIDRQYASIVVDASPMSRPILETLGFNHICNTTPMHYKVP